ncbi:MAG: hypothetical protein GY754_26250 [bacterium]|nr:hypothetical protein [bacterium]
MILIVITWLFIIFIFCGIGLSVQKLFDLSHQNAELILSSFWIGWVFTMIILQIWHFFAPVDIRTTACVIVAGIAGVILSRTKFSHIFEFKGSGRAVFAIISVLFVIWLSNRAMGPIGPFDAGWYHLQSIRWVSSFPLVPGLGNLHSHLAFNSSYFLFLALLDVGCWTNMSHNLANGLLLFVIFLHTGLSISKVVINQDKEINSSDIFQILLICPIAFYCYYDSSTTSTDLPIFILSVLIGFQLCSLLFTDNNCNETSYRCFFIIILSTVGVTIKLSFIGFGFAASLISLGKYISYRFKHNNIEYKIIKELLYLFVPVALLLIPWIIRNIVLSGYIAFPSDLGSFELDWKIPHEQVVHVKDVIKARARHYPGFHPEVLENWTWFLPWVKRHIKQFIILFPIVLLIMGSFLIFYQLKSMKRNFYLYAIFLFPGIASIVFWFCTAPNPRFVTGSFWYLGAGALTLAVRNHYVRRYSKIVFFILIMSVVLSIFPHLCLKNKLFVEPGPANGFYPIPSVEVYQFVTDSGLKVNVPTKGSQCWNAPLPCSYPVPALSMRKNGEIEKGFKIRSEND